MANAHIEGRAGVAPPPDAPQEVSQPLRADAGTIIGADGVAYRPIDKARQNERMLEPLTYRDSVAEAAAELAGIATPAPVQAPKPVQAAASPIPPAVRPPDPTQPAASNTDSPSRGIPGTAHSPHRTKDPLRVEGGFGIGAGEYFALDGTELKECVGQLLGELVDHAVNDHRIVALTSVPSATLRLRLVVLADTEDQTLTFERQAVNTGGDLAATVEGLCDAFHAEVGKDMHFLLSWTYPQYGVLLTLHVQAYDGDAGFTIQKHRREFDEAGNAETPPDALREELGLPIPGRQVVVMGKLGAVSSDMRG